MAFLRLLGLGTILGTCETLRSDTVMRVARISGVLCFLIAASAGAAGSAADYISAAKDTSVQVLDPSLPPLRLQDWLQQLVGTVPIIWEVNDCGEQTGTAADSTRGLPICAGAQARTSDGNTIHVSIGVGTVQQGVTAERGVWAVYIERADGSVQWLRTLQDLERTLHNGQSP